MKIKTYKDREGGKTLWGLFILLPLCLFTFLLVPAGCADDLDDTSVFDGDSITQGDFDKWLYKNYVLPYNIRVIYKLADMETDFQYAALSPAETNQSIQLTHIIKHAWLGAYDEVAGIDFTRQYVPKQILLVGSLGFNSSGSYTLGTAEGGMKIVLYGVNIVDMLASNNGDMLNEYYFHTMHHEFAHILNQNKDYPTEFERISEGNYLYGDWVNYNASYDGNFKALGFVTQYAMSEPREDFAETASTYLCLSDAQWTTQIENNNHASHSDISKTLLEQYDAGLVIIHKKLDMVKKYYKESWGIDLERLHDVVQRRLQEISDKNVDLTSLD